MPKDEQDLPERPKIYVTRKGERYVKADELLRSKRGRERLEAMNELANRMRRRAAKGSAPH